MTTFRHDYGTFTDTQPIEREAAPRHWQPSQCVSRIRGCCQQRSGSRWSVERRCPACESVPCLVPYFPAWRTLATWGGAMITFIIMIAFETKPTVTASILLPPQLFVLYTSRVYRLSCPHHSTRTPIIINSGVRKHEAIDGSCLTYSNGRR